MNNNSITKGTSIFRSTTHLCIYNFNDVSFQSNMYCNDMCTYYYCNHS